MMSDIRVTATEHATTSLGRISASEQAYRELRDMIVSGVLRPGQVVNEQELVNRLGLGRSPVREAIQRLAAQHVMTVFPRRGLAVANLGLEDVQSIFDAREALEAKIAELAALRRTDDEARRLGELADSLNRGAAHGDPHHFLVVEQEFHHALAAAAKSPFLAETADVLLMLSDWVWHQYFRLRGSHASDFFSHDEIIDAVVDRDAERAGQAMAAHVRQSRDLLRVRG